MSEKRQVRKKDVVKNEEEKQNVKKKQSSKKENHFKTSEVIFLIIITCVVSLFTGLLVSNDNYKGSAGKKPISSNYSGDLKEFVEHYEFIIKNYEGEIDTKKLIKDAIEGMVNGIEDDYTSFIDKERDESFTIRLNGSYTGLGVEITSNSEGYINVVGVFKNSPAERAGMKVGDVIVKLNGEDIKGVVTSEFSSKIMNELKGPVKLTINRGEEVLELSLEKGRIEIQSVYDKVFNVDGKKIAYLSIDVFALNTYIQFKNKLNELERDGFDSLIIDVRGNSGGHLNIVKEIISLFLDSRTVIYQTDTKGKIEKFYSSGKENKTYPIVILGDGGSASASEILIGALKEKYGATFVGEKTFGKGTVQELKTIVTGDQYKVTTKKWLTANGNRIDGVGIEPDVNVSLTEEYIQNPSDDTDSQLQKAIEILKK